MAVINKEFMDNVIIGYSSLKKREDEYAVYIKYRKGSERYIDFIMEKSSWYFGKWACFDGNSYVCRFSEEYLEALLSQKKKPSET